MCDLDAAFRAVADEKRRCVVACLQQHQEITLADLAEFVAEHDAEDDITEISAERVRDIYFSLYHQHLPRLEAAGLARYDQENDLVIRPRTGQSILVEARDCLDSFLQEQ